MIMTAVSVLVAACCAAVAVWNIVQRGKLEQQLVNTYDALSRKERECEALEESVGDIGKQYNRVYADYEEANKRAFELECELKATRNELDEARQRTEAVQNALTEVQNIWNYVGNADGQEEVS